ncbi:hypothetical protein AAD018_005620 [Aestuariibius insulae]|uniref:hypothetical protein n=1 Tax=Aestuariibius insulae TaxID=2058287 RepID=UPI00345E59BB
MQDTKTSNPNWDPDAAARKIKDDAADVAKHTAQDAKGRVYDAKADVASEIGSAGLAAQDAASRMSPGSPQQRTLDEIARGLTDASTALHTKTIGELATDLSQFARRNPALFLSGAAVLGFAATRFARASSPAVVPGRIDPATGSRI